MHFVPFTRYSVFICFDAINYYNYRAFIGFILDFQKLGLNDLKELFYFDFGIVAAYKMDLILDPQNYCVK